MKKILLVNQTSGPLFDDVVKHAKSVASVAVFNGICYDRSTSLKRLSTWLVYTLQLSLHLLFLGHRYSRLLVVSNPPFAPLFAPFGRRPYALLLYDLYPDVLRQLKPNNKIFKFCLSCVGLIWRNFNSFSFVRAEHIFTLSDSMAAQLRPYFSSESLWRSRVSVIPPWADTANMFPRPDAARLFCQKYSVKGLLFTYSGNIGITHPLEILLETSALLDSFSPIPIMQFLVIGDGPKRMFLEKMALSLNIPNERLRFLDRLPYSELPVSLSAADLAVVALDGPASSASLPSKTFNALACGTPLLVLAPSNSALAMLTKHHNCGYVIEPGPQASEELSVLIQDLVDHPCKLVELAANALDASRHYTPNNAKLLIDKWLAL